MSTRSLSHALAIAVAVLATTSSFGQPPQLLYGGPVPDRIDAPEAAGAGARRVEAPQWLHGGPVPQRHETASRTTAQRIDRHDDEVEYGGPVPLRKSKAR